MKDIFPPQISNLPIFKGQFDAYQLSGKEADVLFASYPAGTTISAHKHSTDNIGMITKGELILTVHNETKHIGIGEWYHVPANTEHAAKFGLDTAEIEFWFKV